jgi:hypothetical protein
MNITHQTLNNDEISLLASIVGHQWIDMSGRGMFDDNFAWVGVRVETDGPAIEIAFEMEVIDIDGEPDDYPVLHITESPQKSADAIRDGNVYLHGNGERIAEIWILRETIRSPKSGETQFANTADVVVAIKLESMWIGLSRADHFTDAFDISRSHSRETLELPNSIDEWEEDPMDGFDLEREWIQVG